MVIGQDMRVGRVAASRSYLTGHYCCHPIIYRLERPTPRSNGFDWHSFDCSTDINSNCIDIGQGNLDQFGETVFFHLPSLLVTQYQIPCADKTYENDIRDRNRKSCLHSFATGQCNQGFLSYHSDWITRKFREG